MKFSYWLELPMAIITLIDTNNSLDDIELARQLLNTSKAMEQLTNKLDKDITMIASSGNSFILQANDVVISLKKRLHSLEKEKSGIMVQAIKFSIRLSSKLASVLEATLAQEEFPDHIVLTKIKYFLSLIKNILIQLNTYLETKKTKESPLYTQDIEYQFCSIIRIFFEKIESKIFGMSLKFFAIHDVESIENVAKEANDFNSNAILRPNNDMNDFNKKRANSFCNKGMLLEKDDDIGVFSTPQIKLLRIDN
jgi:hypothetical protein